MSQELTLTQRAEQALAFAETRTKLAEIVAKSANIVAVTNQDGREECHRALMVLRTTRVEIQKRGKAAREDATAFGKAVIGAEKELIDVVSPEESRLEALRDEWDNARERERQAKIEAEQKRVTAIQQRIATLRTPAVNGNSPADDLAGYIDHLRETEICEDFGEFADQARDARDGTVLRLQDMLRVATDREEQQRQDAAAREAERLAIEADRKELERMKAEAAERDRAATVAREEADKAAASERAREADEQRSKLDAEATEHRRQEALARQGREETERVRRDAQREQEAIAAADLKRAQDAEAKRLRDEQAKLQADREALAAQKREQEREAVAKAVAEATLVGAAQDAVWLLTELGQAEHITTKKLAAALSREAPLAAAA